MPWRETAAERARALAEQPVRVPSPAGTLVGIHTPADPAAAPAGRCAVLFTRPRSHRNRMWVEAARRLAAAGVAAFRFDYHGTGDSEGEASFLDPGRPYADDAGAVLDHLRGALGHERFVLVGSCFDARTALSAFAAHGERLDGLVFMAAPVVELEAMVRLDAERKDWRHLGRALFNPENWRSLASPARWRHMAAVAGRVAGLRGGDGGERTLSPSFREHFTALVRSRARALFLYGDADAEYASFEVALRTVFAKLPPGQRSRFDVEVWPGEVHGFLDVAVQRRALERTLEWIGSLPAPAAPAERART